MKTDWAKFDECLRSADGKPQIAMKIVIFDDVDYRYAQDAAERYPHLPLYLQPGNDIEKTSMDALTARMRWLVDKVKDDQWFSATVLPQLHVMLWGNMRGV